jgi:hypothetical protein
MSEIKFAVDSAELSDKSKVFDVVLIDQDGDRQPLFDMPSDRTAFATAEALNQVVQAFMRCGSDRAALELAARINSTCNP